MTMEAIAVIPGTGQPHLVERPEPAIHDPHDIKIRIRQVGICGTDREEAAGGRARAPAGRDELVIGHEMVGEVVAVGSAVSRVAPGDHAVFTVRRGCSHCAPCGLNRPDMCRTGHYTERGIWGLDGYLTRYVVDREQYVVKVPAAVTELGVLCEPLSVAEKAIDEAVRLQQARLPDAAASPRWLDGQRCLVAGLGPIGLLAAMVLRLRGAEVHGLDVVDPDTARPLWLTGIAGHYIDGSSVAAADVDRAVGAMDLIVEAAGVAALDFNLLDALAWDGVYVLTGISSGDRPLAIPGASLMRQLVLQNQVMLGSVNAARDHFQTGVDDLVAAQARWPKHLRGLITQRHDPSDFATALREHGDDEIKAIMEWRD